MRVLVAEDDAVIRRLLESFLTRWGYDVISAVDGGRAWEILQAEGAPRIAVLDWMMPMMDGVDICRAVRGREAAGYTYILLLTSRDDHKDVLEGLDSGADDYLTKPFHPDELRARIRAGKRILDLQNRLLAARDDLQFRADHDALTELWNRGAILDRLDQELARAKREASSIGVLLLDLDHFKSINDRHGHLAGDQVLREVAQRMTASVRSYDVVGRYGGEEFIVLLPACDAAGARERAEHLRSAIAVRPILTEEGSVSLTASLGALGTDSWPGADAASLLSTVDAALYRAKAAGRDCAVLAAADDPALQQSPVEATPGMAERDFPR
jgi:two-component system cell cycle response regulator